MGRVGRGQGRFIRRSLPFSPVAAWRQGQEGTGWQGTGPAHTQNPAILTCGCLFEAGTGWDGLAGDRAGSYAESLSWNSLILTCGCLFEAGTGWDGLAGDRAGSYAESLSWNSLILTCGCLFEAGTGWDGLAGDRARS
jgi:hypothetical protein